MVVNEIIYIAQFAAGHDSVQASRAHIEESKPINEEFVNTTFTAITTIYYILHCARIVLTVLCFFKPKLCRYIIYFECMRYLVEVLLPSQNTELSTLFFRFMVKFLCYYFDFWSNFFALVPVVCTHYVMLAIR